MHNKSRKTYEYNITVKIKTLFSVCHNKINIGLGEKNLYLNIAQDIYVFPVFLIYKLRTIKSDIVTWIITEDAVKKITRETAL